MEEMKLGLCKGRHEIPQVTKYIFSEIKDPTDLNFLKKECHSALKHCCKLDLYVTGLTVALVEVIDYCIWNNISLTLWHFNKENGTYFKQIISMLKAID